MASFTITSGFPAGTTVSVYDAEGHDRWPGSPPGAAVKSGTMASSGLSFSGLELGHRYFAFEPTTGRVQMFTAESSAGVEDDVSAGGIYYVKSDGSDANSGTAWEAGFATIQKAVDSASAGDSIYVAPGGYDETLSISKSLTIVGTGGRGAAYVEPQGSGEEGGAITADDVTLRNLGVAGDSAADYALKVGSTSVSPSRFRAEGCKLEGPDGAVLVLQGAGDVLLDDSEFAWGGSGILFDNNDDGYATQVAVRNSRFHNLTAVHVGLASGGGVTNWQHFGNLHDNAEDGTAPTDYLKVDRSGDTGIVAGNFFARTTNEADVITLADGILYVANATEAGWSTARPS